MKILNIDDSASERYIIKKVIEDGFPECTLVQVEDSDQARELLANEKFDLIVQDIIRPGRMNGAQFLRWFRRKDPQGETPVILATLLAPEAVEELLRLPNVWSLGPGAPVQYLVGLIKEKVVSQ